MDQTYIDEYIWRYQATRSIKSIREKFDLTFQQVCEAYDRMLLKHRNDPPYWTVKYEPWTPQEIEAAIQMRNDGMTYEEVGNVLGRTRRAVATKIGDISRRSQAHWTEEEIQRMEELLNEGKTRADIALELGRSEMSIFHKIYRMQKEAE